MNKVYNIFFIYALSYVSLFAQQTDQTQTTRDSLLVKVKSNPILEMQIMFDEFELHRQMNSIKMNIEIDGDPETVWLRTHLAISKTANYEQNFSPHFLSPLERKYHEDSKFNPVRYALGMVQAGAVGYLAYKHIKKYGFLK